jgi:transcriptional regulator with XRE-family HTH domain
MESDVADMLFTATECNIPHAVRARKHFLAPNHKCLMTTSFGDRLDAAIRASAWHGRTQELAERLGVSPGQLSRWRNDREPPPGGAYMVQLPGLLGVDGHWLLTGEGEMQRRAPGEAERRLELVREALVRPLDDDEELPPTLPTRSPAERERGRNHPTDETGSA